MSDDSVANQQPIELHQAGAILITRMVLWSLLMLAIWWMRTIVSGAIEQLFGSTLIASSTWFSLGILVYGIGLVLIYFQWQSISYTLMNDRVIYGWGILSRRSRTVRTSIYVSAQMNQSIVGRLLHYGTIEFNADGAMGADALVAVANPTEVLVHVQQIVGEGRL